MIERLSPQAYAEWDAYVDQNPHATCYHLSGWNRIAARAYKIKGDILVSRAAAGAPIRGGVPLFHGPRPGNHYLTNGVFGAYGPILSDSAETQQEVLDAAIAFSKEKGVNFLHLKTLEGPQSQGSEGLFEIKHPNLTRNEIWVTALLPLEKDPEVLWHNLPGRVRTTVRQSMKNDMEAKFGRTDKDLAEFYDVLARNMHRKGSPIYGVAFMREMLEAFGENAEVLTLWKNGKAISGAIILYYKGVVYVPFASSRPEYFSLRPNNLLYWRIIERGCTRGEKYLDFGTSIQGASTLFFKLTWGAKTYLAPSYIYSRTGQPINLVPTGSGAVQAGVKLWQILPRKMADRLGPWVSKFMI